VIDTIQSEKPRSGFYFKKSDAELVEIVEQLADVLVMVDHRVVIG